MREKARPWKWSGKDEFSSSATPFLPRNQVLLLLIEKLRYLIIASQPYDFKCGMLGKVRRIEATLYARKKIKQILKKTKQKKQIKKKPVWAQEAQTRKTSLSKYVTLHCANRRSYMWKSKLFSWRRICWKILRKKGKQLIASVFLYCTLFSNRLYCYTEIYLQRTPHKFSWWYYWLQRKIYLLGPKILSL